MISSFFKAFQHGDLEPTVTHFWLLAGAIVGSIVVAAGIALEAHWPISRMKLRELAGIIFVFFGVAVEALFTIALFMFDEGISSKQQGTISAQQEKIIALETELAPRNWTKEQFDALQTLKGKLPGVGIVWEHYCMECFEYAGFIQEALHEAGAQIYQDLTYDRAFASGTGIWLLLPAGADLSSDPIVVAFKAAGLNPFTSHHIGEISTIRTDIPVVVVGERSRRSTRFPYFPNYPNGVGDPYSILPRKIR